MASRTTSSSSAVAPAHESDGSNSSGISLEGILDIASVVGKNHDRIKNLREERGRAIDDSDWEMRVQDGYDLISSALGNKRMDGGLAWQFALESIESLRRRFSDQPEVHKLVGIARMCEGDYAGAARALVHSAAWRKDAESLYLLGVAYVNSGHSEKAIAPLRDSVRIERTGHAYHFLGLAHLEADRSDLAMRAFENGLALIKGKPGYLDLRMQLNYFAGMTALIRNNPRQAIEHLRRGKDASTYGSCLLGQAYHEIGKTKQAISAYRTAVRTITRTSPSARAPTDWEYLLNAVEGLVDLKVAGAQRAHKVYASQAQHYLELAAK